jgi:hypothetical protein
MKRDKILYWATTGIVAAGFLMSSFMYLGKNEELMNSFKMLGFPAYFVMLLGVAKLAGALAIVNPWNNRLKEWAYAGFTFTLAGAVYTHIATGTPFAAPLVFLALVGLSYFFRYRLHAYRQPLPA